VSAAIPFARDWYCLNDAVQHPHILVRQTYSLAVYFHPFNIARAGNGDGTVTDDPSYSYLRSSPSSALGEALDGLDKLDVLLESIGLESSQHVSEVICGYVCVRAVFTSEETTTNGAVCYHRNINFATAMSACTSC
jgi:hypothetical protein